MSRDKSSPDLDKAFVADIIQAAEAIDKWTSGVTKDDFNANDMMQSAVIRQIGIIGEAANKRSGKFRKEHAAVPWSNIIGIRNIVLHTYWNVDLEVVWNAATVESQTLKNYLLANAA